MATIITLLQSISPKQDETNVSVETKLSLVFAKAMSAASLNENTISLKSTSGESIPLSFDYKKSSQTLWITPEKNLEPHTSYQLFIRGKADGVKDILGNISTKDYTFNFETGERENGSGDGLPDGPPFPEVPEGIPSSGLAILSSYPQAEELLLSNGPLAVAFSLPLKEETMEGKVLLVEKPLSPLLAPSENISAKLEPSEDRTILWVTPNIALLEGTEYELTLLKGIESTVGDTLPSSVTIPFLTAWGRSYTTIRMVRMLAGTFADGFTNRMIAELIARESDALYARFSRTPSFVEEEWAEGKGPFGAEQYVRYSVVYQMALGQTLETSSGQRRDIRLGDLEVGGATTVSSSVTDILQLLKSELERWWKILQGLEGEGELSFVKSVSTATRGGDEYPYPDFQTRVPFHDLGG